MPQRFFPQNFERVSVNECEAKRGAKLVKWVFQMEKA